jgi:hypothetical protein
MSTQEQEFNRIKEEQSSMELQECTFHPNINPAANHRTSVPVVDRYASFI